MAVRDDESGALLASLDQMRVFYNAHATSLSACLRLLLPPLVQAEVRVRDLVTAEEMLRSELARKHGGGGQRSGAPGSLGGCFGGCMGAEPRTLS